MNNFKILTNGLIKENPIFVLLLGMCPTLATTTSAINGLSMGLASMYKKHHPRQGENTGLHRGDCFFRDNSATVHKGLSA